MVHTAILKLKSLGVKNNFYEIIYMENNIWNNICEIYTINRNHKEIFKVESQKCETQYYVKSNL